MNQETPNPELLIKYFDGTLSVKEQTEVESWLQRDAEERLVLSTIAEHPEV